MLEGKGTTAGPLLIKLKEANTLDRPHPPFPLFIYKIISVFNCISKQQCQVLIDMSNA
jgi:hypothetical protein